MPLSSSNLTHFTDKKENLLGILKENFKVYFCKETVYLGGTPTSFYCPMISFCDIPMSEIKDHIKKYGSYGIGLTKNWAIKNGLNPVLYVASNSELSRSYQTAINHFVFHPEKMTHRATKEEMALTDVLRYMKNYEGPLIRKGELINENYRFSDEREWRFSPPFNDKEQMIADDEDFEKDSENLTKMYEEHRLTFEPNDIRYIIIKEDSEINEFITHLRSVKGSYSYNDVDRLMARIITTEQIFDDF